MFPISSFIASFNSQYSNHVQVVTELGIFIMCMDTVITNFPPEKLYSSCNAITWSLYTHIVENAL